MKVVLSIDHFVPFELLGIGVTFVSKIGSVYMKIPSVGISGDTRIYNCVNLETGGLSYFSDESYVIPIKGSFIEEGADGNRKEF